MSRKLVALSVAEILKATPMRAPKIPYRDRPPKVRTFVPFGFPKTSEQFHHVINDFGEKRWGVNYAVRGKYPAFYLAGHNSKLAYVRYEYRRLIVTLYTGNYDYWFDLSRIREGNWLSHLCTKIWVTDQQLDLVRELERLFLIYDTE